jgi:hypothetical protein
MSAATPMRSLRVTHNANLPCPRPDAQFPCRSSTLAARSSQHEGGERKLNPRPVRFSRQIRVAPGVRLRHHQPHIDVAACRIGVRADNVSFLRQGFDLLAR